MSGVGPEGRMGTGIFFLRRGKGKGKEMRWKRGKKKGVGGTETRGKRVHLKINVFAYIENIMSLSATWKYTNE